MDRSSETKDNARPFGSALPEAQRTDGCEVENVEYRSNEE
jgi:hypothetical protein